MTLDKNCIIIINKMTENSEFDPGIIKKSVRSIRKKENKKTQEYIIKSSLVNSLVTYPNSTFKNDFLKAISERVLESSKGLQRLSFALNIFLKELISKKTNPLDIVLPIFLSGVLDTTFARQLMLGQETANIVNKDVELFLNERNNLLPRPQKRFSGDRNITVRAVEQYLTNFKTYLETTFEKKQNAFLRIWCSRHSLEDIKIIRYLINGWELYKPYVATEETNKLVNFHRKLLNLKDNETFNSTHIKNNYEKVIVYYSVLSKYLTKHNFSGILTAPMSHMNMTYIQIDTEVLYGILKDMDVLDGNLSYFKANSSFYWSSVINTNKYLTRLQRSICNFTNTIQTDGVSICIHYRRPIIKDTVYEEKVKEINDSSKTKKDKAIELKQLKLDKNWNFEKFENDRIIGQDPGRVNLFSGSEKLENGSWKKYSLTKSHFYEKSGIKDLNRKSKRWNLKLKSELEQLSKFSTRSTLESFISYTQVILNNYSKLWLEYSNKKWARSRLHVYSGKKKVYDTFFNSLKDNSGRRVIIAYGDAGFASSSKYELTAPTTRVLTETKKHFKVVMIDEFRTTQIHSESGIRLSPVVEITTPNENKRDEYLLFLEQNKDSPNKKIRKKVKEINRKLNKYIKEVGSIRTVRGLLWYNSTNGSKFINRDFDSSKSMAGCYGTYPLRPIGLSRDDIEQPIPSKKYIYKESLKGETIIIDNFFTRLFRGNILPFTV
jgi:hypothetical protein